MTQTTYSGVDQRTVKYAEKTMLEHSVPQVVLNKMGDVKPMPMNKAETISFRRPIPFANATTPLTEGANPTAVEMTYEDVDVTLADYGNLVEITSKVADLAEDPVFQDSVELMGENAAQTLEAVTWGVVRAGTSVYYTGTSVARATVDTAITGGLIQKVLRTLKGNKATKLTKILAPSVNIKSTYVEASYVGVGHTDLEPDIRAISGFEPVAAYGSRQPISQYEVGTAGQVRYILTADHGGWPDAGGASSTMISTTGTDADVYPLVLFGKNAYGHVALRGQGSIEPTVIPASLKDKADPLGRKGYVGWSSWHAAMILNDLWIQRIECAATLDPA